MAVYNISSGIVSSGITLYYDSMYVSGGGTATNTTINGGNMEIYSGGTANNATVNFGGWMDIESGGTANNATVNSGGRMYIESGATATDIIVSAFGFVDIEDMETGGGASVTFSSMTYSNLMVTMEKSLHIYENCVANNTRINSGGWMDIYKGATATNIVADSGAMLTITVAPDTYIQGTSAGSAFEMKGGHINGYKVADCCEMFVESGGVASNTWIQQGGWMKINNGGVANSTIISGSYMQINDGGMANHTAVYNNYLDVYGGVANSTIIYSSGNMDIYYNGMANHTTVSSGGGMYINNGGMANHTTVSSGGYMRLLGKHGGKLNILSGATVHVSSETIIDFTVAGQTPGDMALITNWNLISGAPVYTMTINVNQAAGNYLLATGTANFNNAITVKTEKDVELGSLSVGTSLTRGNNTYTLNKDNDILSLTVTGASPIKRMATDDLDGNGFSDVILVHEAGFCGTWLTTGKSDVIKWGDLSQVNSGWSVFGTGKTYGSGGSESDIFVTNGSVMGAWTVEKGAVTGWKSIATFDTSTTEVLGLGDFNGDGATDVLLRSRSATGDLGCYLTDGTGWNYLIGLGSEWKIAGVGDLDGNGYDDVIIRHDAGFAGAYMISNSGKDIEWMNLDTLEDSTEILGCGDINGDGIEEVLIRKGEWIGAWFTGENGVADWWGLTTLDSTTEVEQLGDFNHDGITDLRVRTDGGDVGVLYVNGEDHVTWQYFGGLGNEWTTKNTAQVC